MINSQVRARWVLGSSVALCLLYAGSAHAAQWQWDPRIELGGNYNDNWNLSNVSGAKLGLGGTVLDARVELAVNDPRTQFKITPEVQENYYPGHTAEDSNNEQLQLSFNELGLTYNYGLYGNFSSRLLVYTGLPTAAIVGDLGNPLQGQAINTTVGFRQNLLNLLPYFNLQLTPRWRLLANAGYVDSTFNTQSTSFYVNSQNVQGSVGVGFDATPTGTISLTGSGSKFDPAVGFPSHTFGLQAQWDGHLSQTQQYYLRLGADRTSLTVPGAGSPSQNRTGIVAGAGVHWTLQISEIFFDATRSVSPSGGGYAVNQDELRLAANRRLTEKLAVFVGVTGIKYTPVDTTVVTVPAQTFVVARTGFEWRVTRVFSLIGAYNYTTYKNQGAAAAAANQVSVSFVYEMNRPPTGPAITVGY